MLTNSDKKLMALGAGPAVLFALLLLAALVGGVGFNGWVRALAMAGLLSAMIFPALANLLRMRRSR